MVKRRADLIQIVLSSLVGCETLMTKLFASILSYYPGIVD